MGTMFLIFLAAVLAAVAAAILVRRHLDERARRRALSRQKTVELRERYWADQMEAGRERMRREQVQRASQRDLQHKANLEARQRLDPAPRRGADTGTPGQPLYDGTAHALEAGELPRSLSGLSPGSAASSGASSPSCAGSSGSDGASSSSDGGSCGGGD